MTFPKNCFITFFLKKSYFPEKYDRNSSSLCICIVCVFSGIRTMKVIKNNNYHPHLPMRMKLIGDFIEGLERTIMPRVFPINPSTATIVRSTPSTTNVNLGSVK